jgi:hypothetical protein
MKNNYFYLVFKDTRNFLTDSLKSICKSFSVPEEFSKIEMEELKITDVNYENYMSLKDKWLPYLWNDVLSLSYIYFRFYREIFLKF